nr:MAG TPA: hypothetical protein [Bacteriophage sp.]
MAEEYGKEWRYSLERQHSVHNPVIINEDIELQRRMFWESALHTGITVDFYNCKFEQQDFNQDLNLMWDDAIRLPVIFDDAPKVKVLKNLGWYTEDDERPELVYLPMYKDWMTKELLDVKENSIIRLYYFGGISTADFRVTDKKMDSVYGVYWVCKLAPERMNDFTMIELNGEHFLKRSEVQSRHTEYMDKQISDGYNPDYDKSSDFRNYEHSSYVNQIVDNDEDDGLADNLNYSSTENNNVGYTDKESNENTTFTSIDGKKYIDNFDIIENYEKPKKKDNNSDGRFVVR